MAVSPTSTVHETRFTFMFSLFTLPSQASRRPYRTSILIKSPPLRVICIRFRPSCIVSSSHLPPQNHKQPLQPLPLLKPLAERKRERKRKRRRSPLLLLPPRPSSVPLSTRTPVSVQLLPHVLSTCLTLRFVSVFQPPIALQTPRSSGPAPTFPPMMTWTTWTTRMMKSASLRKLTPCREQLVRPHVSLPFCHRVPVFFLLPPAALPCSA